MNEIHFYSLLALSSALDILGILTLVTNEGQIAFDAEIGFNMPVILLSADVQGIGLLILGSLCVLLGLYVRK